MENITEAFCVLKVKSQMNECTFPQGKHAIQKHLLCAMQKQIGNGQNKAQHPCQF